MKFAMMLLLLCCIVLFCQCSELNDIREEFAKLFQNNLHATREHVAIKRNAIPHYDRSMQNSYILEFSNADFLQTANTMAAQHQFDYHLFAAQANTIIIKPRVPITSEQEQTIRNTPNVKHLEQEQTVPVSKR